MKYLIFSVIVFLVSFSSLDEFVTFPVFAVLFPIQHGLNLTSSEIKGTAEIFIRVAEIRNENIELRNKISELEATVVNLAELQEENKLLKDQLNVIEGGFSNKNLLIASVIGNPNDPTGASLIINKGSLNNISVGNSVVRGNYLIGYVSEVNLNSSVVLTLTSPKTSIAVKTAATPYNTEGVLVGQFGTGALMSRILQKEEININDLIVTSGVDGKFFPGLIVGRVSKIDSDASDPLKNAYLDLLVDFKKLNKVFVIHE